MDLIQINEYLWEIPKTGGMRVPGRIYASRELMQAIEKDDSIKQVCNVAHLPGIVKYSIAMPDIHLGYGFPIGGVCATDPEEGGVISPGGVGYDINCGVRLLRSSITEPQLKPRLTELVQALYDHVPTGVGRSGKYRFGREELKRIMREGVAFLRERGLAT